MQAKKSPKADIEKIRGILLQSGLLISLALILFAFQWKSQEANISLKEIGSSVIFEEDIRPTKIKEPEAKKPEKLEYNTIEIVDKKLDFDDFNVFNIEDNAENPVIPMYIPQDISDEPEEKNEIFILVEDMPEFPGGEAARVNFMAEHTVYPKIAKEVGIDGIVYIGFVIEKDGSLSNIHIAKGIGGGCDQEALRVTKLMPKWSPGRQRGKAVRVQMTQPVHFKLL